MASRKKIKMNDLVNRAFTYLVKHEDKVLKYKLVESNIDGKISRM